MTDIPEMAYPRGFSKTRVGTTYGSGHHGEDFGA